VYLYSFGTRNALLVLHHVSYGTVSPYETVASGQYTVAMRGAGAPASASPVLSTALRVHSGRSYTVAGMGPAASLHLQVIHDKLSTPKGRSLIRVIQASLHEHRVTVTAGSTTLAGNLAFASVTGYHATAPVTLTVSASGGSEHASMRLRLRAGTIHTLVVLDTAGGLHLTDLEDAAGSAVLPSGSAATGLGGMAPPPASSPLPWAAALATGAIIAGCGGLGLLRRRTVARHVR
jgi:hypothetical protein